jgi:hypothetical protein
VCSRPHEIFSWATALNARVLSCRQFGSYGQSPEKRGNRRFWRLLEESQCCQNYGLEFLSFPIEDRSVPASFSEFDGLLNSVTNHLRNGKAVGVHCRAGIGPIAPVCNGGFCGRSRETVHVPASTHWSPDGKKIIYPDYSASPVYLEAVDVQSGKATRLTASSSFSVDTWLGCR